jgi:uncharacterized protein (TIGR02646 family)
MLGHIVVPCPAEAIQKLTDEQRDIDAEADFGDRVKLAEKRWEGRTGENKAFNAVRETLGRMRPGGYFCCYCEQGITSAIEHIWPKSLYPEKAFVWENYLLACFRCNTERKGSKWRVFDAAGGATDATKPPTGIAVFIDPRQENPADYIYLDFVDWKLKPHPDIHPRAKVRAEYTVDTVLDLNDRAMCTARNNLFQSYAGFLYEYRKAKQSGRTINLNLFRENLQAKIHPTVWHEMKRQHTHRKLMPLFAGIEEVLDW